MPKQEHNNVPEINLQDKFEEILAGQRAYIESLIKKHAWAKLEEFLNSADPHEIASVLEDLDNTKSIIVFRLLGEQEARAVFAYLSPEDQEKILHAFTDAEAANLLSTMDPDDRTKLLGDLPADFVTKLLRLLPVEERKIANNLLNYPEGSAGRLMTPKFVSLHENLTAEEALKLVKSQASQKETIYTCYVTNDEGVLTASVELEDIILAPEKKRLKDFMKEDPVSATTDADKEEIARLIQYYDMIALPITDKHHRLVGIITHDDIMDILQDEATEDFQRFTGINPSEVNYLSGSLWSFILNRSGWVLVLLLLAGFSQDMIIRYGALLEHHWMELSLFFTVLVGVGGNVGSQSSVLVIRGIATGEIGKKDTAKLFWRALVSGVAMGLLLASVLVLRILLFKTGGEVKWIAALAMVLIVTVANLLGAMLPIILKKFKIDPAVVSAPLISTLMDLGGLILYLEIARWFYY